MDTTRRHRNSTSRHGQRLPSGAARPGAKGSSAVNQRPARARSPGDGANQVLGGALIAIAGLAWAVGLALTAGGSNDRDWSLLVKLAPWVFVIGGFALTIYGVWKLKPTVRG